MDDLLAAVRFIALVQGIIGCCLLAGLVIWKDDFRR